MTPTIFLVEDDPDISRLVGQERAEQLGEGHFRLRDDPKFHFSANETGRHDPVAQSGSYETSG
jgi:hypothetical protein